MGKTNKDMSKSIELLARSMGDHASQNIWKKKHITIAKSKLRASYTDKLGR